MLGPAAFVGGWITSAAVTDRPYSSIEDAISRLAAAGTDTRPLMTAGFVAFGIGMPLFALSLRTALPGPMWMTAAATGLATLGVAATPLDHSAAVDRWHALFAGLGYVTLATTPLLAVRTLRRTAHPALADAGVVAGVVSAISLALTMTGTATGLLQRIGLTAADAWVVATALVMLRNRLGPT